LMESRWVNRASRVLLGPPRVLPAGNTRAALVLLLPVPAALVLRLLFATSRRVQGGAEEWHPSSRRWRVATPAAGASLPVGTRRAVARP
jgi:hypothetical protein